MKATTMKTVEFIIKFTAYALVSLVAATFLLAIFGCASPALDTTARDRAVELAAAYREGGFAGLETRVDALVGSGTLPSDVGDAVKAAFGKVEEALAAGAEARVVLVPHGDAREDAGADGGAVEPAEKALSPDNPLRTNLSAGE